MSSRREFLYSLGSMLTVKARSAARTAKRWNVLFVGVDDLRPQLGCFGDSFAHTPNIDAIARRGTVFRSTYCQQALCGPSRASLLTGLRPDTTGVYDLNTRFRDMLPDAVTLPQMFKQNGYFTQNIGKIFHGNIVMNDPESWSVPEQLNMVTKSDQYVLEKNRDPKNAWHKTAATECVDVWDAAYIDGRIADAGVKALRQMNGHPFFLAVGFNKPHLPFAAPKRYWDLFHRSDVPMPANPHRPEGCPSFSIAPYSELRSYDEMRRYGLIPEDVVREVIHGYYAAAAYTDANIGLLMQELERRGLRENTIVVLWADHGWHLGELDYWGKTTNYEVCTRVPLIVSVPGKARQTSEALVELLDVYPTLAELCDLVPPRRLQGRSFAHLLDDASLPGKKAAFSQFPRKDVNTGNERLMGYSMRTTRYRYTEWLGAGYSLRATELYDQQNDPHETRNIASAASNAQVVQELSAMLHQELSLPLGSS